MGLCWLVEQAIRGQGWLREGQSPEHHPCAMMATTKTALGGEGARRTCKPRGRRRCNGMHGRQCQNSLH